MFGLGMSEIIFLAIFALIVIGPKELPQLARTLGRFLNELKRTSNILQDEIKQQVRLDRFDLDSAMSRPSEVKAHEEELLRQQEQNEHPFSEHHPEEPQQMELSETQDDEQPSESDENKKS